MLYASIVSNSGYFGHFKLPHLTVYIPKKLTRRKYAFALRT